MNIFKKKDSKSKNITNQTDSYNKTETKVIRNENIVSEKDIDNILLNLPFEEIKHMYEGCQINNCKYCLCI